MKNIYVTVVLLLFAGFFKSAVAQNISNEGLEFWTVFPTHDPSGSSLATMNVNVTSKSTSEVTVSCGSYTETQVIPANTVVTFLVPRSNSYVDYIDANRLLTNKGIHIVVTPGKPKVVAYSHVFAGNRSAATLILPYDALGQKYFSMNYLQDGNGKNFMVFVAADDNTNLTLHKNDGSTTVISLTNKGDVYEYMPTGAEDLTGSFIEVDASSSCKRFAAFSGSTSVGIVCNNGRDPLLQQLYSINSWGKVYGVVPFINRKYIIRVLAQEDNTTVTLNGATVAVLNRGKFYEQTLTAATIISADKLISVAEYSLSQNCSSLNGTPLTGDPEMVLLNPIEFNIKNITVFSSDRNLILERYVNVFMKTAKTSTFRLNGAPPANGSWQPMPSDPTYSFIQIQVYVPSLTLTADEGFNAIAYGFGQTESYAYSAGTNLASTQFLLLVNKLSNQENAAACVGQAADFKLTLPYALDRITWKFDDGTPDFPEVPAIGVQTVVNGQVVYVYNSPVNKIYDTVGPRQLKAVGVISPASGSCAGSEIEFDFNIDVDPLPTATIIANASGCSEKEMVFSSTASSSNTAGKAITKWFWDFGDGTPPSTDQNPKHTYSTPVAKTYKVTLMVGADNGCLSPVAELDVAIGPKPIVDFNTVFNGLTNTTNNTNACINSDITFTDKSTIGTGGTITQWLWDFGDPSAGAANTSSLQNPIHQYSKAGTYTVTLIVQSNTGCESVILTKTVTVTDLPKNDFELPEVCAKDGIAIFKNLSTDYNGNNAGLTNYLWDYGEPSSGALNTSTARDGNHKYAAPGNYKVTLTITNVNNCNVVLQKDFTVNDSNPIADFSVLNTNFCSDQALIIKNTSRVDIGVITRLEWYFDGVKELTDENPVTGKDYTFTKPLFGGNSTKTYTVRLLVFSGETCSNEISKQITIKPSPQLTFTTVAPICENDGIVKITQASENSGILGTGIYSGSGIKDDGTFNPKIAGPGLHTITYTFTSQNGCPGVISSDVMVFKSPLANAGPTIYMLSGGEKIIPATAEGIDLTFKWVPSIGLNKDDVLRPVASPTEDTEYVLTATTAEGCSVTTKVLVKVLGELSPPSSFSPNGDGINDVWNIKLLDSYPENTVEIFNRSGQKVFNSLGYNVPFDGTYHNDPLPVGVYYYIINPKNGRKAITGSLTIIR
jgi:gliding motility-associated-like protein